MMEDKDKVLSTIQINHCVFDEIRFKRIGFRNDKAPNNDVNISVNIGTTDDTHYIVSLTLTTQREHEYDVLVKISAYCSVSEGTANLQALLRENIPAILLPYARAELTMLTSQPETDPIVLPVINVHELSRAVFDSK